MGNVFITPQWFFGYDIMLELLFAITTLLVSYFAGKVYKLTMENQAKLFSYAFFFIGMSYVVQSILNFLMLQQLADDVCGAIRLQSVYHLNLFGIYLHAILFLIGLLLLVYIALKIDRPSVFALLLVLVFPVLYFSSSKTFSLYLVSSTLLGFTAFYYLKNYISNRRGTSFMIAVAMITLFISYVNFMFAIDNSIYYVIAHIIELLAYLLILISLWFINSGRGNSGSKNGKKKR